MLTCLDCGIFLPPIGAIERADGTHTRIFAVHDCRARAGDVYRFALHKSSCRSQDHRRCLCYILAPGADGEWMDRFELY